MSYLVSLYNQILNIYINMDIKTLLRRLNLDPDWRIYPRRFHLSDFVVVLQTCSKSYSNTNSWYLAVFTLLLAYTKNV